MTIKKQTTTTKATVTRKNKIEFTEAEALATLNAYYDRAENFVTMHKKVLEAILEALKPEIFCICTTVHVHEKCEARSHKDVVERTDITEQEFQNNLLKKAGR